MNIKLFIATSIMMFSIGLYAQPQGDRPTPPKQRTPEEIDRKQADRMKAEVNLTDKQYKKVYKLIRNDQQYRQSQAEQQFGGGMPPMGGGPGGMMGGGPGRMMGGGMPPMGGGPGGMGGSPGGMPAHGEMGQGPLPGGDVVTEEYLEKQDLKLKKILTDEQYSKWRSKHPSEHLELPPMKFN